MDDHRMTAPVAAALVSVYFFWGTTYLAMKFAIETLPPFIMLGLRFTTAGAIMFVWEWIRLRPRISWGQWRGMAMVGALMLLGGTGGVAWSEQVVPSNIAAIVVATVPLWIAIIRWVYLRHDRPARITIIGLVTGFGGIIMLVASTSGPSSAEGHITGLVVLGFATFLWASGSLYSRVADQPDSPALAISMQMLTGGLMNLVVGIAWNGGSLVPMSEVSIRSATALGYLVVFGSIVGFSSYIWLLKKTDPALASSYAYVNPVVAIILGWLLAGESLNAGSLAATAVILLGVVMIVRGTVRPAIRSS
ncbi:MAG TPA: EamA family transporter [Synergistales bacterium]|nr:EamA family transporter [Synergistaceae bacterium]HOI82073.1 EamA family transporter [Synergistales bacterium]